MPTLYLDVYFLINFTVDAAAVYLAARICRLPVTRLRVFLAGVIGGASACVNVFLPKRGGFIPLSALLILLAFFAMARVMTAGERLSRTFRYMTVFLLGETAIGGAVWVFYGFLERYVAPRLPAEEQGYRRKLLLAAVILLFGTSAAKLLLSVFKKEEQTRSATVVLTLFGRSVRVGALVDSGNLAVDPMDGTPVLFVKEESVLPLLPPDFSADGTGDLPMPWSTRLRLIPYATQNGSSVAVGFSCDFAVVTSEGPTRKTGEKDEKKTALTFAVDPSGGDYGGYSGLLPPALLN